MRQAGRIDKIQAQNLANDGSWNHISKFLNLASVYKLTTIMYSTWHSRTCKASRSHWVEMIIESAWTKVLKCISWITNFLSQSFSVLKFLLEILPKDNAYSSKVKERKLKQWLQNICLCWTILSRSWATWKSMHLTLSLDLGNHTPYLLALLHRSFLDKQDQDLYRIRRVRNKTRMITVAKHSF